MFEAHAQEAAAAGAMQGNPLFNFLFGLAELGVVMGTGPVCLD